MKTIQLVRNELNAKGVSISEWAKQHNVPRSAVVYVLRGGRALRGQAHKAAVLLQLKDGVVAGGSGRSRAA